MTTLTQAQIRAAHSRAASKLQRQLAALEASKAEVILWEEQLRSSVEADNAALLAAGKVKR